MGTCELMHLFCFVLHILWRSYDKNYKKLLDNILKNDLALKGDVNGIEILILPSIQLPEKSERKTNVIELF